MTLIKIENNLIVYPPYSIIINNKEYFNFCNNEALCIANGYYNETPENILAIASGEKIIVDDQIIVNENFVTDQRSLRIKEESEKWAQEEKKYMQLISKTNCCGQTTAQNAYKAEYQAKKQDFINLVIAIRKGEA